MEDLIISTLSISRYVSAGLADEVNAQRVDTSSTQEALIFAAPTAVLNQFLFRPQVFF